MLMFKWYGKRRNDKEKVFCGLLRSVLSDSMAGVLKRVEWLLILCMLFCQTVTHGSDDGLSRGAPHKSGFWSYNVPQKTVSKNW